MKIREIYAVIREHSYDETEPLEGIKSHCIFVLDEAGEFLYGGGGDEELSVKFQMDDGTGWKDFDPEND
jgi:hypothetical protein